MEDIRIDSHKLIYHPGRVAAWLNGENIYPLSMEVAPTGSCNHRCIFCALDYMEYKPVMLDKDLLMSNITELAKRGLRSIVFAGEGEPLLNKNTPDILNQTKYLGVDTAMSSNGVLFTQEIAKECMAALSWVRFSVSASTDDTYEKIHRCRKGDLARVLENLSNAVEIRNKHKLSTTIGVQLLLIPENLAEVISLGKIMKEIGVDYYTVKPFSKHPQSICGLDESFTYATFADMEIGLKELENDSYKVFFRSHSMKKLEIGKVYNQCWGLPFFVYIDANANVLPCVVFLGNNEMTYGNLKEASFVEIWEGARRKELVSKLSKMDISKCRELCRLDEINVYLHSLKNPGLHNNFI